MSVNKNIYFPPEWAVQLGIMIAWPDGRTDWASSLEEVIPVYVELAGQIARFENLLIICRDTMEVSKHLGPEVLEKTSFFQTNINDTWTRDFGPVTIIKNNKPAIIDYGFNGWGNKFDWDHDNKVTQSLFKSGMLNQVDYINRLDFVLEGGSIETDGQGTLLTTSMCLLSGTRNGALTKAQMESALKNTLGVNQVLWLNHGHLQGDDTDGHIDTLARFCDENTIAYVACNNKNDSHFHDLRAMETELKAFRDIEGNPYRLVPLPMVSPMFDNDNNRLPATYANFLIINGAVLVPVYGAPEDEEALRVMKGIFPSREIIPVNCVPLIKQHGSLHCITMQLPEGVLKTKK